MCSVPFIRAVVLPILNISNVTALGYSAALVLLVSVPAPAVGFNVTEVNLWLVNDLLLKFCDVM